MHLVAVGGSEAGISAANRATEVAPDASVTVITSDPVAHFSTSGIPFFLSGEVPDPKMLEPSAAPGGSSRGYELMLDSTVHDVDRESRKLSAVDSHGKETVVAYDKLIIATGAVVRAPDIDGLQPATGGGLEAVHAVRSVSDTMAVARTLETADPHAAVVIGAGYVGIELAEALALRGLSVTLLESQPEILPVVDRALGSLVCAEIEERGVEVLTGTVAKRIQVTGRDDYRYRVEAMRGENSLGRRADMVLLATGSAPNTGLARAIGVDLGAGGAIVVDGGMGTSVPDVFAAGDCAVTHHRLLGEVYLPYGTTATKQGRVAGENAAGGNRTFGGTLGTQIVKVFDHAVGRTGLLDVSAASAGFDPLTVRVETEDHNSYYPGSRGVVVAVTADRRTRRVLGAQFFGHVRSEIASRVDVAAAAIFAGMSVDQLEDLDLSYTPPLGQIWNPLVRAAQEWQKRAATGG